MEDFFESNEDSFDFSNEITYTSTVSDMGEQYVIPKGTKNIEIVDEVEVINGIKILYTKSGKSFAEHQVETLNVVYKYATEESES